ncbi:MAG: ADP-ribosylglycohydrolase family protein [Spirochaetaceae bacterium]|nr:ADP-ribosylglycohydrolase family protein [Spirochaetaceae bacterium]
MKKEVIQSVLTAFAVGDALGMPTEFMTRNAIKFNFGLVDRLVEPELSQNHPGLKRGSVTDDTEQVLALLDEYCNKGRIDGHDTARRLLQWMWESGAVEKGYIGPSSRTALEAIEKGADIAEAGSRGTTCGGIMRSPAAILFALSRKLPLEESVYSCLLPTHRTQRALEAALAYSYAMRWTLQDGTTCGSKSAIARAMEKAAQEATASASHFIPEAFCGTSIAARLRCFEAQLPALMKPDDVLDFLYDVFGTGLDSVDVAAAVLCIFSYCGEDTWLALRMGASIGGDTDTIAALAGALSAAYGASSGYRLNIPETISEEVISVNSLGIEQLSERLGL